MESLNCGVCPNWKLSYSFELVCRVLRGRIFWVPRKANRSAHALANWVLRSGASGWFTVEEVDPSVTTNLLGHFQ